MSTKGITKTLKVLGQGVSKNGSIICTSLAVGGVITTSIFAIKATPKALTLIEDQRMVSGPLTKREIIKVAWRCYIPAASMAAMTIACIIGSHSVNQKRNAALATAYGITETAFREYKEKVVETIGKNKELKVRDDIDADHIQKNPPSSNEVIVTGKGQTLCYDSLSGRYFKSDIEQLRRSINKINKEFLTDMWVSLNDLYYEFGLSDIKMGDLLGWDLDEGLVEVKFSSQLSEDGEPCLVINYTLEPRYQK